MRLSPLEALPARGEAAAACCNCEFLAEISLDDCSCAIVRDDVAVAVVLIIEYPFVTFRAGIEAAERVAVSAGSAERIIRYIDPVSVIFCVVVFHFGSPSFSAV